MKAQPNPTELPPQLRELAAKALHLPEALRDGLHATLIEAAPDASPDHVLAETFGRLGYLPQEASRAAAKILASPPQG